jgi:hypothetical protein
MITFTHAWMLLFSSVDDVITFHGVNVFIFEGLDVIVFKCRGCYHFSRVNLSFLKAWMLSFLSVEDNVILSVKDVIIFHGAPYTLCYHFKSIRCYLFIKVSK